MASKSPAVRTTRRRLHSLAGTGIAVATLDEHLSSLAQLIEERSFAADEAPQLIRITRDGMNDEGIDVGMRLIGDLDDSVVSALTGFTAPADWLAIGVSTGGNAYLVDEGHDARRRVRLVHLVSRTGLSASVVRLAGEEPRLITNVEDGSVVGRVDDVCRRALGLATTPAGSTLEYFAAMWLERLLQVDATPTTWEAVAAEHPAVRVFAESRSERLVDVSEGIVRFGTILSDIESWPALRRACCAGRLHYHDVSPTVARWLDDGAFSRWVLGAYPPLDQLVAAVCELLSPPLAERVHDALRDWKLQPTC
jgi:hypothetical protein